MKATRTKKLPYPYICSHICDSDVTNSEIGLQISHDNIPSSVGYARIFGGAVCMKSEQFVGINGYSNTFFGWGGEDDDIEKR